LEDFDRNYQTLTCQIQKPELDFDLTGAAVRNASLSMNKMIEHLRTIYNTVNQIQQMKVSDQNNEILRTVKSVNMKSVAKTLEAHEKLKGSIDTLLINIDDYKITGQNKTKAGEIKSETLKLIPQMKEIASQIQKTLKEIKDAK